MKYIASQDFKAASWEDKWNSHQVFKNPIHDKRCPTREIDGNPEREPKFGVGNETTGKAFNGYGNNAKFGRSDEIISYLKFSFYKIFRRMF